MEHLLLQQRRPRSLERRDHVVSRVDATQQAYLLQLQHRRGEVFTTLPAEGADACPDYTDEEIRRKSELWDHRILPTKGVWKKGFCL